MYINTLEYKLHFEMRFKIKVFNKKKIYCIHTRFTLDQKIHVKI